MKLVKNRESGQALVMALILLALGSLLVVPGLNLSSMSLKYHDMIEQETLLAFSADSGVNYGLCEVYNNPQQLPLDYSYIINDTTVHVAAEYVPSIGAYQITSTATGVNNKSVTLESYVIIEIGLFGNAFACDGNLNISNCNLVSSTPGECDVYANGNVLLQNSTVDGDVISAGSITLLNSSCLKQYPNSQVLDFPAIDPAPHQQAALEGGTSGSITWKNLSPQNLGPKYIDGNLTIAGTNVILQGTVYVTGDVSFTNANVSGFGDIVAMGNISLNNYTFKVAKPSILPLIMTIGVGKEIKCTNDGGSKPSNLNTQAVLYAPDGVVNLNNVYVLGSAAANQILVTNAYFSYPASLKGRPDLPGAGLKTISYGYK